MSLDTTSQTAAGGPPLPSGPAPAAEGNGRSRAGHRPGEETPSALGVRDLRGTGRRRSAWRRVCLHLGQRHPGGPRREPGHRARRDHRAGGPHGRSREHRPRAHADQRQPEVEHRGQPRGRRLVGRHAALRATGHREPCAGGGGVPGRHQPHAGSDALRAPVLRRHRPNRHHPRRPGRGHRADTGHDRGHRGWC